MAPDRDQTISEREQTDESLRAERETTDQALGEEQVAIDEIADAVISRARMRADAVLAASRAKMDRRSAPSAHATPSSHTMKRERALEDRVLREERADADEVLREERAEQAVVLAIEREETDKDLLAERARSDGALAARDDFLGIVSHDLRGMLNSIVLSAGLIGELAARDSLAKTAEHAARIQRSGARMERLIGDLIDVASIDADALAVTRELSDPAQVVAEAVDTFRARAVESGIALTAEVGAASSPVAFDSGRILQVLANLLSNAIKFTPRDGRVTVRVERVSGELRFAVSDTGAGIPADKLEAVFQRFFRLQKNDRRGLGLGLYISKCIVQGHGGRIWAESERGEGSTFRFTLPLAASAD